MNKKFINALLFSAALLSTGMVSSCKDYDDDIDALDNRVTAVETTVADLQKKIAEGKWITKFERNSSNNGYILTLSDSSTLEIKDGEKGADGTGTNGKNGTEWKIDSEGYWVYKADGDTEFQRTDPAVKAEGENGLSGATGEAGKAPEIDPDTQEWITYQWNSETQQWDEVETGVSAVGTSSYVIEFDLYYELHMATATVVDDETVMSKDFTVIRLPKTASITSIQLYKIDGKQLSDPELTVAIGDELTDNVKFGPKNNERTYAEGTYLSAGVSNLVAQVNPTDADATLYDFQLKDSKGTAVFNLEATSVLKTDGALTRAATENVGFWNMTVSLVNNKVEPESNTIYSIVTTDANGTAIASGFDTKITIKPATTDEPTLDVICDDLDVTKAYTLQDLSTNYSEAYIADYYFTAPPQELQNCGATISDDGRSITVTKAGKITLTVTYLTLDGKSETTTGTAVTFKSSTEVSTLAPFNWTITTATDKKQNVVSVDATGLTQYLDKVATADNLINSTDGKAKITASTDGTGKVQVSYKFKDGKIKVNGDEISNVGDALPAIEFNREIKNGATKWTASMNFDYTKVYDTDYVGTLTIVDGNETYTSEFEVSTKLADADRLFKYTRNAGYFSGDNATAFPSDFDSDGKSTYSLNALYKDLVESATPSVTFEEEEPAKDGEAWLGATWSQISVPDASDEVNGAYTTRKITVSHYPLNSSRFNKVSDVIYVIVKSSIYEDGYIEYLGTYDATKKVYNKETKEITVGGTVEYNMVKEFKAVDYHENVYNFVYNKDAANKAVDSRVATNGVTVVASEEIADYVTIDPTIKTSDDSVLKVTRKSGTSGLVNDLNGNIIVSVKDKFGKIVKVNVPVIVKK